MIELDRTRFLISEVAFLVPRFSTQYVYPFYLTRDNIAWPTPISYITSLVNSFLEELDLYIYVKLDLCVQ